MSQPSIPKGTRDFGPDVMIRRNFIFSVLKNTFERFGFAPMETPSMENLSTLTGKYGDEGDQLIFKILNSGDFLKDVADDLLAGKQSKKIASSIAEKALRYDLTVPFARYVAMNRNTISFPFRRYQVQPVWRADRPQKGRYREFYQCDADIIGSDSLVNEVELIQLFDVALSDLGLKDFTIRINNRKILNGLAERAGCSDQFTSLTVAIDKLDKIGIDGVLKELSENAFTPDAIEKIKSFLSITGSNQEKTNSIRSMLGNTETGQKGLDEMEKLLGYTDKLGLRNAKLQFDITLARGLNYYTGTIFEVVAGGVQIGSICGGGRYDDLTGIFGWPGISGVGISFGADRIYDVMAELSLFPENIGSTSKVLFINFGTEEELYCMTLLKQLREKNIAAEIYPEAAKLKKQMKYADDRKIPFVILAGSQEIANGKLKLRNMADGLEVEIPVDEMVTSLIH